MRVGMSDETDAAHLPPDDDAPLPAVDAVTMAHSPLPGLYIVATPIGNLGDIGRRAAATLATATLIAAEDTRVTGRLLHHLGIKGRMLPYHDHSDDRTRERILDAARTCVVALVSDAGTPLISDPGFKLVRAARAAGVPVMTVPGPSAMIAAASIAGLPTDRLLFAGFLPAKAGARDAAIAELGAVRATIVLYESGPRTPATLAALLTALGPRDAAVARELTKLHEECRRGLPAGLMAWYEAHPPKGEIVLLVGPPVDHGHVEVDADALLREALAELKPSQAAAQVAKATGFDRRELYARALELQSE